MYRLFYEEITGQFFVANDIEIESRLEVLRNKLRNSHKPSFKLNDYCKALGIPKEDPFDYYQISLINYDVQFLFQIDYSMCYGIPAMRITLAG